MPMKQSWETRLCPEPVPGWSAKPETIPAGYVDTLTPEPVASFRWLYVAFCCCAFHFVHRARWAAAIFLRPDGEIVCFAGAKPVLFAGCDPFLTLAHRARCACAILRRVTADTIRVGRVALRDTPEPFKDAITEIAWSSFSTSACARLRSARSCCSARCKFGILTPFSIWQRHHCIGLEFSRRFLSRFILRQRIQIEWSCSEMLISLSRSAHSAASL